MGLNDRGVIYLKDRNNIILKAVKRICKLENKRRAVKSHDEVYVNFSLMIGNDVLGT